MKLAKLLKHWLAHRFGIESNLTTDKVGGFDIGITSNLRIRVFEHGYWSVGGYEQDGTVICAINGEETIWASFTDPDLLSKISEHLKLVKA